VPKLHEIIAVGTGKKGEVEKAITESYHIIQKPELFDSVHRTYRAAEDGGEQLPPERKNAQHTLGNLIQSVCERWAGLFDITLTMDAGNQIAKADIIVEDGPTIKDVPVPTLLFLEKQLDNMKAFIEKLPIPDPAEVWKPDANSGMLSTEPTETSRTKKVQKPLVLFPATDKHPAQTQLITEDVVAGFWKTIKYTSRVSTDLKSAMLGRVDKLRDAVKTARERANSVEVNKKRMGADLVSFVFGSAVK
jgi:hypothetical protein